MKLVIFGSNTFDRHSIPQELKDFSIWPAVDETALPEDARTVFRSRRDAIRLFVEESSMPIARICKDTGITAPTLYRLFERCCKTHPDGRIYGFRALIPYTRMATYTRTQPLMKGRTGRGGHAGAFGLLLEQYPKIQALLAKEVRNRTRKINSVREVRSSLKTIHKKFLDACREAGIKPDEYPFNQDLLAIRSLSSHLKRIANRSFDTAAKDAGALKVGAPFPSAEHMKSDPALRAFEFVEFDGHKIDCRLTLRITDPFGLETRIELSRIWILVLLEVASRAALGYTLALGKEYNKDDVAMALQAALAPHKPRLLKIPKLSIQAGGGFPSCVIPQTEYACWEWFRFDNARTHIAEDTLRRLCEIVGCWTDAGWAGEPNDRPFIERFFSLLARHFAHRLPGTTGGNPEDIVRQLGDPGADISLLIELDELEDLIEVLIADYNGEPGASGRSPLEALTHLVNKRSGFPRALPRTERATLCLLQEARCVTIKGSLKDGTRPHINFENVRYSSDVLSNNPGLIGKKLMIYFDVRDTRMIRAFFADGAELGILTASKPWCFTPHSLRVRQEIFRLKRLGKLSYKEGDDPVEAWVKYKRAEAKSSKSAANDLAKVRSTMKKTTPQQQVFQDDNAIKVTKGTNTKPKPRVLNIKRTFTF